MGGGSKGRKGCGRGGNRKPLVGAYVLFDEGNKFPSLRWQQSKELKRGESEKFQSGVAIASPRYLNKGNAWLG